MNSDRKLLIVVVMLSILSHIILVFHYEQKLQTDEEEVTIIGGWDRNKKHTASEILQMIKNSPEYIGDSVIIYSDGKLRTDNPKFQGTIDAVSVNDKAVLDLQAAETNLPKPYLVYKLAAHYYRLQYKEEFTNDSLK